MSNLELTEVRLDGFNPPRTFYNRGTHEDRESTENTFQKHDFDFSKFPHHAADLQAVYDSSLERGATPLIIDLGAHIGEASVWFASLFPEAKIFAIEPDGENLEVLKKNAEGLKIEVFHCAVSDKQAVATLVDPGRGSWGYMLGDATDCPKRGPVAVIRFPALMQIAEQRGLFPLILKFNIEGAEKQLFSGDVSWIDSFPLIIGELHDWMLPHQGISAAFLRAVADRKRDFLYKRFYVFSFR
jgi:FkbM family methyltransferase